VPPIDINSLAEKLLSPGLLGKTAFKKHLQRDQMAEFFVKLPT
jgi:hypothetical protein